MNINAKIFKAAKIKAENDGYSLDTVIQSLMAMYANNEIRSFYKADLVTDKFCNNCKKTKPLNDFSLCKNGRVGRHTECRECNKKRAKEYYIKRKNINK